MQLLVKPANSNTHAVKNIFYSVLFTCVHCWLIGKAISAYFGEFLAMYCLVWLLTLIHSRLPACDNQAAFIDTLDRFKVSPLMQVI